MEPRFSHNGRSGNAAEGDGAVSSPHRPLTILFVTSRFPGPLLHGDQVRAYHQLRLLGPRHRITLVSFTRGDIPVDRLRAVERLCQRVVTVPLDLRQAARGLLRGALSALPLQVALHQTAGMRAAVRQALARDTHDVVHVQLARMAPYLHERGPGARVVDLVDALSVNMRRRHCHERGLTRWLARLEAERLLPYEQWLCQEVKCAMVSSPLDREAIGPFARLVTVPNGVDLHEFEFERAGRDPHTMIFTGNMGYFPNVDAACWLAESILPRIRSAMPQVSLRIVGAQPAHAVRRLARTHPSVTVSGYVAHMHPHLRTATIAVAPVRAGSGHLLKVLEAMATGTPVVATSLAARGIGAHPDEHLLVADDPESFARQAVRLLEDPALAHRLALSARRLVEEHYTWERSARALEAVYRSVTLSGRHPPLGTPGPPDEWESDTARSPTRL